MRAEIERSYTINCTHQLPKYPKCAERHTHKYEVIIYVHAWVNEETGMVIDLNELDQIIDKYNDKDLNKILELPTVEHLAQTISVDIVEKLEHYSRIRVSVKESENTKVTITR